MTYFKSFTKNRLFKLRSCDINRERLVFNHYPSIFFLLSKMLKRAFVAWFGLPVLRFSSICTTLAGNIHIFLNLLPNGLGDSRPLL
ncbi:hypothetical protein BpHYR1_049265 [Brachionus plicatilis]|uniref:Uncharacterized protein n=1 Tax=Brachionus plicatilis TaxID=10195 RepID=A0A3M7R672_BRAPC|nr:hypothetical protein BpHYR1_049265 [Brachionus plicatilis]